MSDSSKRGRSWKPVRAGFWPAETGNVAPFRAMCGGDLVETGWDLDGLLKRLVALTRSADPSDYAVWSDEPGGWRLAALVFANGSSVVFWRVVRDTSQPTADGLSQGGGA
jgi:hypothetical protein